jgi:hypothetical protein
MKKKILNLKRWANAPGTDGEGAFEVTKVTNALEPRAGETLIRKEVNPFVRDPNWTVNIVPATK